MQSAPPSFTHPRFARAYGTTVCTVGDLWLGAVVLVFRAWFVKMSLQGPRRT